MSESHFEGGCQCGAVRYGVDVDLSRVVTCNCSRCQRLGSVLAFVPLPKFTLHAGEGATTEYLFATQTIRHLFCKTCGIESFAYGKAPDGSDVVAVNANCLDGVDPRQLSAQHYDGASR